MILFIVALAGFTISCATTRQTSSVEESGFLGDYSMLQEGEKGQAQFIYINPDAQWSSYDKLIIDSVTIWSDPQTDQLSGEERQALTDSLYGALVDHLGKDYQLVRTPDFDTIRLRAAITQAKASKVVMNAITSTVPQTRLLGTLVGFASDKAILVGAGSIEMEIEDSVTGERLVAAVDQRIGTKTIRGSIGSWKHVNDAFQYWAELTQKRLAEFRAKS